MNLLYQLLPIYIHSCGKKSTMIHSRCIEGMDSLYDSMKIISSFDIVFNVIIPGKKLQHKVQS